MRQQFEIPVEEKRQVEGDRITCNNFFMAYRPIGMITLLSMELNLIEGLRGKVG